MQESKEVTFAPWLNMEIIEEFKDHAQDFARLMSYYTAAMMEIETKFKVLNIELNRGYDRNPIENIKTRLKSPRSIVEKMQRIGKPVTVVHRKGAFRRRGRQGHLFVRGRYLQAGRHAGAAG